MFDFANLEYISSAGLRLVIAAYKKMAGKEGFRIVNVSDEVYDVFSLTGFDQKINGRNTLQKKSAFRTKEILVEFVHGCKK